MAEEKLQPVPCVFFDSMRAAGSSRNFLPVEKDIDALVAGDKMASLDDDGLRAQVENGARRAAHLVHADIGKPQSASASGRFGVTTAARGSRMRTRAAGASRSRASPPLATITGSRTRGQSECSASLAATDSMIPALESMPILTASAPMSFATESICGRRSSGGTQDALHARVFCAVRAVMAHVPNTPCAAKVFRSAWIPAPPPESDPRSSAPSSSLLPARIALKMVPAGRLERNDLPSGSSSSVPRARSE